LAGLGEILAGIVDDTVSTKGRQKVLPRRIANRRDLGAEVLRKLEGGGANCASGAIDHHLVSGRDPSLPQIAQGVVGAFGDGGSLFISQIRWDQRQHAAFRDGSIPGMTPETHVVVAEDTIANLE
jgi:hypothetical protein